MENNNELLVVSALLQDKNIIQDLEVNPDWFENQGFREIAYAINLLKGQDYRIKDVYNKVKTENYFYKGSEDELIMLRDMNKHPEIIDQQIYFLEVDYVDRELQRLTGQFQTQPKDSIAEQIQNLLERRESLKKSKDNGTLSSSYEEFKERLEGNVELISTWKALDQFFGGGLSGGQLVVVGARPAVGKTAMGLNMADQILKSNEDCATDFFSLEMDKLQVVNRLIAKKARINSMLLRNPAKLSDENRNKANETYKVLAKRDMRVFGSDYGSLNDIKLQIRKRATPNKYVAFIDYAGLINVADSRKNERQALNEVTRELKLLTNELQIAIVLFAQLNRGIEGRQDKKPTLADLKESGSLEQDANVALLLSQGEQENEVVCNIAKNREGNVGLVPFKFNKPFMDFDVDFDKWRG